MRQPLDERSAALGDVMAPVPQEADENRFEALILFAKP